MSYQIEYIFVQPGRVIDCKDNLFIFKDIQGHHLRLPYGQTFVLDVGNSLDNGVIDHHQPGIENLCAASIVYGNPDKWIGRHLKKSQKYYLVTHTDPDFDALGSLYLTEKYIRDKKLSSFVEEFVNYIHEVDSGKKHLYKSNLVEPFSIILAISSLVNSSNLSRLEKDLAILRESYKLFDIIWDILSNGQELQTFDWDSLTEFKSYITEIKKDYLLYQEDLRERSQIHQVILLDQETKILCPVDCLITIQPKSLLWKYWARGDTENTLSRQGFILTTAFLPSDKNRAIIAVDPNLPYTLKGLGIYLDFLEMKDLLKKTTLSEVIGEKRPGFHRANPWYDGRSGMHNFTIIDSPLGGSNLTEQEIKNAILNTSVWTFSLLDKDIEAITANDILNYFGKNAEQERDYV